MFGHTLFRYVSIGEMQGAKNEGEGASMQTYMTEFAFRRKRSRSPVMYRAFYILSLKRGTPCLRKAMGESPSCFLKNFPKVD